MKVVHASLSAIIFNRILQNKNNNAGSPCNTQWYSSAIRECDVILYIICHHVSGNFNKCKIFQILMSYTFEKRSCLLILTVTHHGFGIFAFTHFHSYQCLSIPRKHHSVMLVPGNNNTNHYNRNSRSTLTGRKMVTNISSLFTNVNSMLTHHASFSKQLLFVTTW